MSAIFSEDKNTLISIVWLVADAVLRNRSPRIALPVNGRNAARVVARAILGRVDEFWRDDVFGIPELNQT
jgi:hypothetical protein